MSAIIIGQILINQFRVEAFIDSGSMGAVYRVLDLKRNVPLAMKVLHSDLAADPGTIRRFQHEADNLLKLAHPNIVPFYGLYQSEERVFLLEGFVDGASMSAILRKRQGRPVEVKEALVYLKGLCAALGYAHASGVVHCDVKPGNVLVDRAGNVYLTDFGIARQAQSSTMSMSGAGTPAYMAPEQVRRESVSPATDVYALGVLLFEMLTGRRPFLGGEAGQAQSGDNANERVRFAQANLAAPDPRSINPNVPAGISTVILKAMSKHPQARYPSTQAFFSAACSACGISPMEVGERVGAAPMPPRPNAVKVRQAKPQAELPRQAPSASAAQPARQRSSRVLVFLLVGISILVTVVFALAQGKPGVLPTYAAPVVPVGPASPTDTDFYPIVPPTPSDTPDLGKFLTPFAPSQPTFLTPAQGADVPASLQRFEDLATQKYTDADYLRVPGYFSYTLTINPSATLLWLWGWCATDQATLDENINRMQVQFNMNGQPIPLSQFLKTYNNDTNGLRCLQYLTEVKNWAAGQNRAVTALTFNDEVNDGTYSFAAGQQVFEYNITVRP